MAQVAAGTPPGPTLLAAGTPRGLTPLARFASEATAGPRDAGWYPGRQDAAPQGCRMRLRDAG